MKITIFNSNNSLTMIDVLCKLLYSINEDVNNNGLFQINDDQINK